MNNTGYQATVDLRPETVAADPTRFEPEQRGYSQYDLPMKLHPHAEDVLVVGAGSGNDAAGHAAERRRAGRRGRDRPGHHRDRQAVPPGEAVLTTRGASW